MNRRAFLNSAGSAVAGSVFLSPELPSKPAEKALTALDVDHYLRSLCEVGDAIDKIIIGDPKTIVTKIGTCWMPYMDTLKNASDAGVNTLIVHEHPLYTHWDLPETKTADSTFSSVVEESYGKMRQEKVHFIEKKEMVLIRCHDVMDKVTKFGIPFALGQALGFSNADIIRSKTHYNVYEISPAPAKEVAKKIAAALKVVHQPGVAFYGDPNYKVRTVGVGTGCICNPLDFMDLKPDLFLAIDDSIHTWVQPVYAQDSGQPLVVINHGTSEEFGMRELADHLRQIFKEYKVLHFDQGCGYRWITA